MSELHNNRALQTRIAVALALGLAFGGLCYAQMVVVGLEGADFTWAVRGARQVLLGVNPYHDPALRPANPYPYDAPLYYPLPALLIALPFTPFSYEMGAALFFGVSTALLAFALSRDGYERFPLFMGVPFLAALNAAQWSPLLMAAALLPGAAMLLLAKPNLGVLLLATYPSRRRLLTCAAGLLISVAIAPNWLGDWYGNIGANRHDIPLLMFPGVTLLLALPRWREPTARLLLLMALLPQRLLFYDQLPLWLICRTRREATLLSLASWIGFFGWYAFDQLGSDGARRWVVLCVFLPALALVLRPTLPAQISRVRSMRRA